MENGADAQHKVVGIYYEDNKKRTDHPDAQWFSDAALGMFIHWGISSVHGGIDLSWGLYKDTPWDWKYLNQNKLKPTEYFKLADRFDPSRYDPDRWLAAAAAAGVTYAVLTTHHVDGYALWPSKCGDFSTRTHMHGRDLLRPYVEACRRHGIRVGFYYAPVSWYTNRNYMSFGYPKSDVADRRAELGLPTGHYPPLDADWEVCEPLAFPESHSRQFLDRVRGQIIELLTGYGKIDLLWFDGNVKEFGSDPPISIEEIRELQPGIVVNPRLHESADFLTYECSLPEEQPRGWWECCDTWNIGGWGYTSDEIYRPLSWMLERLSVCRAWEGNLLINVGPNSEGELPENCYRRLESLARWMRDNGEAIHGVRGGLWPQTCSVPAVEKNGVKYLYLNSETPMAVLKNCRPPREVSLLKSGEPVQTFIGDNGNVIVSLNITQRVDDMAVVRVVE